MPKRYASPAEFRIEHRRRQERIAARAELVEKAAREERELIQNLGLRGPGKTLREIYETKFVNVLTKWLDGAGDEHGQSRSHEEIRQELHDCRELIRRLTPEEKSHGRSAAEDPDPN